MFESISGSGAARIFSCPKCKETIDTSAEFCRFCGAPIDVGAAEVAAELMAHVNQACSDAGFLKIMAIGVPVAFVVSLIPFVSLLGALALTFLCFGVPAMVIRWWVKFSSIQSNDSDFRRARGIVIGISVVSVFLFIVGVFQLIGLFVLTFGH
ncbi:MAG: zinc ribbon domain-containing protein [Terracidiphilus sp.]